ncbi:hypothetical protein ACNKHK_04230 [Shigella flexneri]
MAKYDRIFSAQLTLTVRWVPNSERSRSWLLPGGLPQLSAYMFSSRRGATLAVAAALSHCDTFAISIPA